MYAQKLEGDSWIGERMDVGKIERMSGELYWFGWREMVMVGC